MAKRTSPWRLHHTFEGCVFSLYVVAGEVCGVGTVEKPHVDALDRVLWETMGRRVRVTIEVLEEESR